MAGQLIAAAARRNKVPIDCKIRHLTELVHIKFFVDGGPAGQVIFLRSAAFFRQGFQVSEATSSNGLPVKLARFLALVGMTEAGSARSNNGSKPLNGSNRLGNTAKALYVVLNPLKAGRKK